MVKLVPKTHLMSEAEWRAIGVQQSKGWVHYMTHSPGNINNYSIILMSFNLKILKYILLQLSMEISCLCFFFHNKIIYYLNILNRQSNTYQKTSLS